MDGLTEERKEALHRLERKLGVTFHAIELLHTALVHSSYAYEGSRHMAHNERLEFLGDAVLELASSTYLFTHFPKLPEGELTKTRAKVVCSTTLAKLATKLTLGEYLLLGHGEEMTGGRTRATNLENSFESVLGAIYLDQGWETAKSYAMRQLAPEIDAAMRGDLILDYKTKLQEFVQKQELMPVYELLEATGPSHRPHFVVDVRINGKVYGKGDGSTKREAEQLAAREALERMHVIKPQTEGAASDI